MKTNRQTFESSIASDSKEIVELDDLSLRQVAGGDGPTESMSFNYSQIHYSYN